MSDLITAALEYATKLDWHVFPCGPDKRPLTKHGWHDASTDPDRIAAWWTQHPQAAIGIACEPSEIGVVDLDGKLGIESFKNMCNGHEIGKPAICETPGGGLHLYFDREGFQITSTIRAYPNIDIRANGAYVLAPPSPHQNGGVYMWVEGRDPYA